MFWKEYVFKSKRLSHATESHKAAFKSSAAYCVSKVILLVVTVWNGKGVLMS